MNNNTLETVGALPPIYTHALDSFKFAFLSKASFDRLYLFYAFPTIGKTHAIDTLRKKRIQDHDERDRKIILLDTDDLVIHAKHTFGHSRDYAIASALLTYLDQHPTHYIVLFTNLWTLVQIITAHDERANVMFAAKYQPNPWLVDVVVDQAQHRGEKMDKQILLSWLTDDAMIEWFDRLKAKYESKATIYNIAEESDLPVVRRVLTCKLQYLALNTLRKKVTL